METLVAYPLGKPLWPTFAIADRVINKLGAGGVEGCRLALDDSQLSLQVPDGQLDAAVKIMTTNKYTH